MLVHLFRIDYIYLPNQLTSLDVKSAVSIIQGYR